MTALAADTNREKRGIGRVFVVPVKDDAIIYKGAIVCIDDAGFAVAGVDAAAHIVAGVAIEKVDNTNGGDGGKKVRVDADAEFRFAASAITQAMLGQILGVVDDNTVDDAGPTNDIPVGRMTEFLSTTLCWVYVPGLTDTIKIDLDVS